ncbi:MAG: UDP-N-acetylmuramate dehydrogenase [Isosphaeraceae bacterium]
MHLFDDFREIVQADEPLAPHVWFRLGGPAAYLARPKNVDQLLALVRRCRDAGLPFKILSGGTNVLVRDEGVKALVIHMESPAFSDLSIQDRLVDAGAAVPLTALISQSARAGLAGLEIFTGVPGTVGGALRGNATSRHGAIGQFVRKATVIDAADEIQVRERDDLAFADRGGPLDEPIILSAQFELEADEPDAVVRRMRRIWIVKKEGQPYGHQSTGYIFKSISPDLSAATLIEQAGLKGARHGGAEVSERHANFIVAQPDATAADVLALIDQIRQRVWQQFGYELELQIQVW